MTIQTGQEFGNAQGSIILLRTPGSSRLSQGDVIVTWMQYRPNGKCLSYNYYIMTFTRSRMDSSLISQCGGRLLKDIFQHWWAENTIHIVAWSWSVQISSILVEMFNMWVQGTRTLRSDAPVVASLGDCGGEGWKVPAKNYFCDLDKGV